MGRQSSRIREPDRSGSRGKLKQAVASLHAFNNPANADLKDLHYCAQDGCLHFDDHDVADGYCDDCPMHGDDVKAHLALLDDVEVPYYAEASQYLEDVELGLHRWADEPDYMTKVAVRTIFRERNRLRLQSLETKNKT